MVLMQKKIELFVKSGLKIYCITIHTFRCPQYPPLPSYCSFTTVAGQCCPSLHCNSPTFGNYNPNPQLIPTPRPNVAPTPGQNPHLIVQPGQGSITSGQGPIVVPGTNANTYSGSTDSKWKFVFRLFL